jgi:hypothetical protein
MAPAEHEKQSPFLVIQLKRSPAVEMNDLAVVERDRIVGRYRPDAPRALRLSHVFSLEVVTITHAIRASNRTNVGALRDGVAKSVAWISYSDIGAWTYC